MSRDMPTPERAIAGFSSCRSSPGTVLPLTIVLSPKLPSFGTRVDDARFFFVTGGPSTPRAPSCNRVTAQEWSQQIGAWADEWHDDLVKFLARRTASAADAQDLAQEVYLRLLRVERQELVRQPRSYMLRIAANLLHEWRLTSRQSKPHDTNELASLEAPDDPEYETMAAQRLTRLNQEFAGLTAPVRAALVLQVRDGLSYEQIAKEMNVTPRMIKRYLVLAYAALRARMPPEL